MTCGALRLAALTAAAALWGLAVSGTKFTLGGFGPLTLLSVQLSAATVALWVAVTVRGGSLKVPWRLAAVLGPLEPFLAYIGDTFGLTRTSAANATVIDGLEASFVVVLAALFLRERIGRSLCLAVVAGLLGLFVLERVSWLKGPGLGDLFVLGGVASAALYTIAARGVGAGWDALALTAGQFTVATVAILPTTAISWISGSESAPVHVSVHFWVAAGLVGIAGFGASFLLYNWSITTVAASSAAVILNLIPVFGLASAVLWLHERLTAAQVAAAVLILTSVVIFAWAEMWEPAHQT